MTGFRHTRHGLFATAAFCAMASATPAAAQTRAFNVPAQPAETGVPELARQADVQILVAESAVRGRTINAVKGRMTAAEALRRALAGTGLRVMTSDGRTFTLGADHSQAAASDTAATEAGASDPAIVVTGSRVRGAATTSPKITLHPQSIREEGHATLAEALRDVPQNFGGGQNPGISLSVPESVAADVGGGSSVNLRGLGSDATLTLLNGKRIAYNGALQAVDVSLIPLGAVERLDIVPDGSSALYGSDAVGGVVNIILRRDYDGLEARARIGGSTDGGNFQQQYAATGGMRWATGGVIVAAEYNSASEIEWYDRDYTRSRSTGLRLFPELSNRNALISLHQKLADGLTFSVDSLYNDRRSEFIYSYDVSGDRSVAGMIRDSTDRAFAVSPSLAATIGAWQATLFATYAQDKVDFRAYLTPGGVPTFYSGVVYDNVTKTAEASANGPLFAMPGGSAKLAVGGGYSRVSLESDRGTGNTANFDHTRDSQYLYGELVAPLISPDLGLAGFQRVQLSAALRYEHYQDAGSVATPKLGILYSPASLVDFKASWGQSFRAPTMYQRYSPLYVSAYRSTSLGGSGFPAGTTVLYMQGRNEDLKPERATTWSVTADFHPASIPGLLFSIDYFSVRYIDRIVTPILYTSQSLSNSQYSPYVTLSPSQQAVAEAVANATIFSNSTGTTFDPATVVAIVDNRNVNAGRQSAHGVDAQISYQFAIAQGQKLSFAANASYLDSTRQLTAGQVVTQLAGNLYNPPHWRGRTTLGWRNEAVTVTAAANYTGELLDVRKTPAPRMAPQTTFDLTVRYAAPDSAPRLLRGIGLGLTAQNIFNVAPPLIATTAVYETPYDTTNYRPFGRFLAIELAKKW